MNLFLASVCIQLAYLKRLPFRAEIEREKEKEENVSIRLLGIQKKTTRIFFRSCFLQRGARANKQPRNLTEEGTNLPLRRKTKAIWAILILFPQQFRESKQV